MDAAVRARDIPCHDFYSVRKTSIIPSYSFGHIRADFTAARPIYLIFQETFVSLTLRRLMSYIYGAPILDVSRTHTTTQHSR